MSELVDPNKPFEAAIPENMQRRGVSGVLKDIGTGASTGLSIGSAVPVIGNVIGGVVGAVVGLGKGLIQGAVSKRRRKKETAKQKHNWLSMRRNMDAALRRDGSVSQWDPAKTTTTSSSRPSFA